MEPCPFESGQGCLVAMTDGLGSRMKKHEDCWRVYLPPRTPLIIRVDGRAFHTLTHNLDSPWDFCFHTAMVAVAAELLREISGAKLAYLQSDEVSVLVTDYDQLDTQSWLGKGLQKLASVSASIATAAFLSNPPIRMFTERLVTFDARAFTLPREEVCNYFLWRQRDAERNSIQSHAHKHFSHQECLGLSCKELITKLESIGFHWNQLDSVKKRGCCVIHGGFLDLEIPIFSQDRAYIERHVDVDVLNNLSEQRTWQE